MKSLYPAAKISKPDTFMPALVGTPGTMDEGSETFVAHPLFLGLVSTLLGSYPTCSPGLGMVEGAWEAHGLHELRAEY